MNRIVAAIVSIMLVACQNKSVSISSKPSSPEAQPPASPVPTQSNSLIQKYESKLVQLDESGNYLAKETVLYRVNNSQDTHLTFIYAAKENQIKAVLLNCTTQEAEEVAYYQINEVTEKILDGYLPPDDPKAKPVKHEPYIPISVSPAGYSTICE